MAKNRDDGLDDDFIVEEWQFVSGNNADEDEDDALFERAPQPTYFVDEDEDDEDDDDDDADVEWDDADDEDDSADEDDNFEEWLEEDEPDEE